MFRLQYLQLQRYDQTISFIPITKTDYYLTTLDHGSGDQCLLAIKTAQAMGIRLFCPFQPCSLNFFFYQWILVGRLWLYSCTDHVGYQGVHGIGRPSIPPHKIP